MKAKEILLKHSLKNNGRIGEQKDWIIEAMEEYAKEYCRFALEEGLLTGQIWNNQTFYRSEEEYINDWIDENFPEPDKRISDEEDYKPKDLEIKVFDCMGGMEDLEEQQTDRGSGV